MLILIKRTTLNIKSLMEKSEEKFLQPKANAHIRIGSEFDFINKIRTRIPGRDSSITPQAGAHKRIFD